MEALIRIKFSGPCYNTGTHRTEIPNFCLPGRPIRDFIPIPPGRYHPNNTWRETLMAREEALRNRHMKEAERLSDHTKRFLPLSIGDHVRMQNQVGPHPLKWDKTGIVIEIRRFDPYVIRVDGSGRVTLRNRKFLRRYIPVKPTPPRMTIDKDLGLWKPDTSNHPTSEDSPGKATKTPCRPQHKPPANTPNETPPKSKISRPSSRKQLFSDSPDTLTYPCSDSPTPNTDPPSGNYSDPLADSGSDHPLTTPATIPLGPQPSATTPPAGGNTDAESPRRSSRPTKRPAWHKDYEM